MEKWEKFAEENMNTFINLLKNVNRQGANIDGLINKLLNSDFFQAPASTKYHNSHYGGLVDHSLNVYYNLKSLVNNKHLDIDEDSIIICGLLHDISKMNFYEKTVRNVKKYSEYGSKSDELGRFDWVAEPSYKTKEVEDRFIYGNHEETSEFMIRQYIPLKLEESVAIISHHGGEGYDSVPIDSIYNRFDKYPLATLLHVADIIATRIDERE